MALSDDVTSRISSQRLIELTNDGDPTATTIDTTILGLASTDVAAEFELLSSEVYDNSNPVHLAIAVDAVMAKLYQYQGKISPNANESYDIFVGRTDLLKEGDIPGPLSNSNFLVENETSSTRKAFDPKHFSNRYRPGRRINDDSENNS